MQIIKLTSGYWHLRGDGLCNWTQPPYWPCDEKTLRDHAFPQASEKFLRECINKSNSMAKIKNEMVNEMKGKSKMEKSKFADYLGDGVYVDFDGYQIVLKVNDFDNPTDTIALEFSVMSALKQYEKRLIEILELEKRE